MKLRMVWLRGIDVLYLAFAWTIVWGGGMLVAFYVGKEPLMPFVCVWVGGITFAAMTWICEFALPYLHRKWLQRLARHRKKRSGAAVDPLTTVLEAYDLSETDSAAVDKLFRESRSGKITPIIKPPTENTENEKDKG